MRKTNATLSLTGALVLALGACANPEIEAAQQLNVNGQDVSAEAAREYRRLAVFEHQVMWDTASAVAFSEKALAAVEGRLQDSELHDMPRDAVSREEIERAYRYLSALRAVNGDDIAPKAMGQAIARLDCWREQAREGYQELHIGFCRDGVKEYLSDTAKMVKATGKEVPVQSDRLTSFQVMFPLGSSVPDVGANLVLDQAAALARSHARMRVVLGGHADKSGAPGFNQRLSHQRAERVAALICARGVAEKQISVIGFGETYPRVVTPDGQRSRSNRRVEIVIGPDRTL